MKQPVFTGVSTAVITPFCGGKIDYASFGRILKLQRYAGVAAITVCGTTGEAAAMTYDERIAAVKFCRENCGDMKLIAGAGSNSTENTVALCRDAESAGADALLVVTPYYNKPTQSGLIAHFLKIADNVSKPLILYNVPSRTGVCFTAEAYKTLSAHPMINGIKEASGSFALVTSTLSLCGDEINIWSGNDDITVPMMSMGAKGVISVASNVIPRKIVKMTSYASAGDYSAASAMQIKLNGLITALFRETNPIPVKAAAKLLGLCSDEMRLPMVGASLKTVEELKGELEDLGMM